MKLLISVKNLIEARATVDAGVDILDIKEPENGPLGKADDATIDSIATQFGNQLPVTAAFGELKDVTEASVGLPQGLSLIKLGMSGFSKPENGFQKLERVIDQLPPHVGLVVTCYLDGEACGAPTFLQTISWLRHFHAARSERPPVHYFLFDTWKKGPGVVPLAGFQPLQLKPWIDQIHELNMLAVLAGSIQLEQLPTIRQTGCDVVGIRGAVSDTGNRELPIAVEKIRKANKSLREN